jgi:hypothetical protein
MVAHEEQGLRRLVGHLGAAVEVSLPVFRVGARRVVGQWAWLARCGSLGLGKACGRREGRSKIKEKQTFSFFPYCNVWGKKKEEQCRSKRHRSFFFNYETASFWRKRAVSFKSGARTRQVSNQPLIIFFPSIASLPISVFAPLVGRVFHFSPWPLIYAIEPLIDQ